MSFCVTDRQTDRQTVTSTDRSVVDVSLAGSSLLCRFVCICPLSSSCVVVAAELVVVVVVVAVVVASSDAAVCLSILTADAAAELLASSSLVSVSQLVTVTGCRRRVRR